jgi:hypothetical protein
VGKRTGVKEVVMATETNTTVEVVKAVVPVGTFILGYAASQFDRRREAKQNLRNMRSILFREMLENYRMLNAVVPGKQGMQGDPFLYAQLLQGLSTSVYQEYLGRLDNLKPEEIDRVYAAYSTLEQVVRVGGDFLATPRDQRNTDVFFAKGAFVMAVAEKLHSNLASALQAFPDGEKELRVLEGERGNKLVEFHEIPDDLFDTETHTEGAVEPSTSDSAQEESLEPPTSR